MSRYPVQVRDAAPEDAGALLEVWGDFRRTGAERAYGSAEIEAANALARIAADPDERLLVGIYEDKLVGATHLMRAGISPLHTETAIHVTHLHVLSARRSWRRPSPGRRRRTPTT